MIPKKLFCARYPVGKTWRRTRYVYGEKMSDVLARIPVGKEFEFVKYEAPRRRYGINNGKSWSEVLDGGEMRRRATRPPLAA